MCVIISDVRYYHYIDYHNIIVNIMIMIYKNLYRCIPTCMNMDKTNDQIVILAPFTNVCSGQY